ncbi:MAG: dipeptide ABC transporter ATP-binding protein [Gammaproteobacteria bacterium]|nr:dipeptide ABC transporter ATP-binding protein [Gammaproteobacteria bacterium]
MKTSEKLLSVNDLTVHFDTDEGVVEAVNDVSLDIRRGEIVGLVGESGSGKTVTAQSILRLVPRPPARFVRGEAVFNGENLLALPIERLRKLRGAEISMIFQEPMTALSPLHRVGRQLSEMLRFHTDLDQEAAWRHGTEWLDKVGLPDPEERMSFYPHHLSGGMRQRVMIAMALMLKPQLIIADEPSTALDVTVQAQIFRLLMSMKDEDTSMLLITHDLAVVWEVCDRIYVMKNSRVVERGALEPIFKEPAHAYTRSLLQAVPRLYQAGEAERRTATGRKQVADTGDGLIRTKNLRVWFPVKKGLFARTAGHVKAVDDIDLAIGRGSTVGLVGESGSGKTTLGRAIIGLQPINDGSIVFEDTEIGGLNKGRMKPWRRNLQMIFQDPYSSLNPRMTVMDILTEGLREHGLLDMPKQDKAVQLLEEVELRADMANRYPFEFSGGERQRISIARALSLEPKFIVCDEAVSALDVTIQAQIIDLLRRLQARHGIAYLFISHDLSVVRQLSEQILVMHQGRIVERGRTDDVIFNPQHEYTRTLLDAVPVPGDIERRRRMRSGK